MANYIIIGGDGREYGPVSGEQLRQWIADGRAHASTQVRTEGATGWQPLSAVPELAAGLKSAPPPPLSPAAVTTTTIAPKITSALAVTSLVLGILGMFSCGITALAGLICGIAAMVKVKNSGGRLGGGGLALAGTIVSGIFLLMIPVLAAMMLPALAAAKQKAEAINCVNNEKELALAIRIYSGNNNDKFPPAATWCDAIGGSPRFFKCPAADSDRRCDYAFNAKLDGMDASKVNPQTVMIFESDGGWNANGGFELMIGKPRHARIFVVALADGSVRQVRETQLNTLRWNP